MPPHHHLLTHQCLRRRSIAAAASFAAAVILLFPIIDTLIDTHKRLYCLETQIRYLLNKYFSNLFNFT